MTEVDTKRADLLLIESRKLKISQNAMSLVIYKETLNTKKKKRRYDDK